MKKIKFVMTIHVALENSIAIFGHPLAAGETETIIE
jgi:hypothetical protein